MKNVILILSSICLLASCTSEKPLYSWGKYERASYDYLKNSDDASTQALIDNYKSLIEKQTGTRNLPPPGIFADYAFILMQIGKTDEGVEFLKKEAELYPESKIFIEKILKMIEP